MAMFDAIRALTRVVERSSFTLVARDLGLRRSTVTEAMKHCLREIARHESAEQSYMNGVVQILELARNAQRLFERQEPRQKRRLPNFVLSNCSWEDGEVAATFRQPFDLLAETTDIAARRAAGNTANSAKSEIRLEFLNTVRTERFAHILALAGTVAGYAKPA